MIENHAHLTVQCGQCNGPGYPMVGYLIEYLCQVVDFLGRETESRVNKNFILSERVSTVKMSKIRVVFLGLLMFIA